MGLGCPISNLYSNELSKMQSEFEKDGLQIIGIHANAGVTIEEMAEHKKEFKINFPVLLDADQSGCRHAGNRAGLPRRCCWTTIES